LLDILPGGPVLGFRAVRTYPDRLIRMEGGDMERELGQQIERYLPRVLRLASALTRNVADAEDAVGNVVTALLSRPGRYDASRPFFPYFARCVVNATKRLGRQVARRSVGEEEVPSMTTGPGRAVEPIEREESAAAVRLALAKLPAVERAAVLLVCAEGLSQTEAAEVLGEPQTTVSERVRRGLGRMRAELTRAGLAGVTAASASQLLATMPCETVPATLAAKIGTMTAGRAAGVSTGSVAIAAGKEGVVMKVILGVVLAGALAGGAALFAGGVNGEPASPPPKPEPPKGPPKLEYVAWCDGANGYLDGPRFEATGNFRMGLGTGQFDEGGNIWWGGRRLDMAAGLITTVFGDDCWNSYFQADEGPADAYSNYSPSAGFGQSAGGFAIQGNPLEGGEKNCLYMSNGSRVARIWKNDEKGGRWWFRKIVGEGKTPAPRTKGQSVPALEASLRINVLGIMPGNRLVLFGLGSFYEYKDGKLICLLGFDDYKEKAYKDRKGQPSCGSLGVLGGDGVAYTCYYFGDNPMVERILPDGKVEPYLLAVSGRALDGPGMRMGMFCGPHIWMSMNDYRYIPPDCLFLHSHDDSFMRRARNGRVATLCKDGEWRELDKQFNTEALACFRGWNPGPNGTANVTYKVSKGMTWLVSGIDYAKPTLEPLLKSVDSGKKDEVKP
jgi:RNA polymerase sigma-70 factor (ECF subfamily)